ncbi:MAG: hypothetical protein VKK04_25640 [Synechococcales bacterium]|nr:hypothetical protein [Synechococcales bacterium]
MKLPSKIGGVSLGLLALFATTMVVRAVVHSPVTEAQDVAIAPDDGPAEESTEAPAEASPEPPATRPAQPMTAHRQKAQDTLSVLLRHIEARGYELSKMPRNEMNAYCWENRPRIQQMQDQLGLEAIAPGDLVPFQSLLVDDITCRMAAHYDEAGVAPEWSNVDLYLLEGVPPELRQATEETPEIQEVSDVEAQ